MLPTALIFFNSSQLVWSGLYSSPDEECNSVNANEDNRIGSIFVGCLLAALSLLYTAFRISNSRKALSLRGQPKSEAQEEKSDNFFFFHLIMLCSAAYIAMLLTGWALNTNSVASNEVVTRSMPAVWVKNVTMWVSNLLYIWILIAPAVCKNRDFGW